MFTITKGTFSVASRVIHIVEALYDEMRRDGAIVLLYVFREGLDSQLTYFRFVGKKEDITDFLTIVEQRIDDYLRDVGELSRRFKLNPDQNL